VADGDEGNRVEVLRSLLTVAREIVRGLEDDPLFVRLTTLFTRMPEEDREIVIGALEREVQTRLLAREVADDLTQIDLRPNPNARVYLRVVGPEDRSENVEMVAFMRAAYSLQRGIDALDPQWQRMATMALRQMDPAARAQIDAFNRTVRVLLDDATRSDTTPTEPAAEEPAPVARDTSRRRTK